MRKICSNVLRMVLSSCHNGRWKDGYELSISYEEAEADIHSIKPDELRKSLHAGLIPEVYADVISDIRVEEVRRKVRDEEEKSENVNPFTGHRKR